MNRAMAASLLLLSAPGLASAAPAQIPMATVAGFTAIQVTTTDPARLVAAWRQPGPGVRLQVENHTVRGKPITTFINFKGCRTDAAGTCDVVARMRLIRPDGSAMAPDATLLVWPHRAPVPAPAFALSPQAVGVTFDNGDAPGTYRLESEVTDRVAGTTVHLEGPIILAAAVTAP